tara:strand:- start:4580 stop:4783 length:204 start_codon:yes stop_codon:yes gene_type:complete
MIFSYNSVNKWEDIYNKFDNKNIFYFQNNSYFLFNKGIINIKGVSKSFNSWKIDNKSDNLEQECNKY